jgi:hypothetical protein
MKKTENLITSKPVLVAGLMKRPWNWGKRKPLVDDVGDKWCDCKIPKLTSNAGGRGQALCLLCGYPWFH